MSKEAVEKFVEAINGSKELKARFEKAVEGSKDASSFAALGKENAFQFTAEEATAYFKGALGASKPAKLAELDEESLSKAAGGKGVSPANRPALNQLALSVKLFQNMHQAPSWSSFGR